MIENLIAQEGLPGGYAEVVERYWQPLATAIARRAADRRPLVVGINGAQGSGKSTLCLFLEDLLKSRGLRAVTLSLDDLYLTRAERKQLAEEVHPLFATRGVPGTHAPALGISIVEDVLAGRSFDLPRFDKASDDRHPDSERISGPVDVLLLEGWCVGAKAQETSALARPVNALEEEEDAEGIWRGVANQWLATDYARLFDQIDLLVMLKVENFSAARRNRTSQEDALRAKQPDAARLMDDAALDRFMQHYERLTLHMLAEMPARADIVYEIGADRRPVSLPQALGTHTGRGKR